MDDDFNIVNGIIVIFEMVKWINLGYYILRVKEIFVELLEIFGIVF